MRSPVRRPWVTSMARRSPRWTWCNTVWRATPRRLAASARGTKRSGTSGTKRARISSVRRMRQGALGVVCSPGSSPSLSQRRIVNVETPSCLAASWIVTSSVFGSGGGAAGMPARKRALHARAGERQAGSGASALTVEDRGDLLVGVMDGESADQVDRVLAELGWPAAGAVEADLQLGAGAALPEHLDVGAVLAAVDRHDDLADQRAGAPCGRAGSSSWRSRAAAGSARAGPATRARRQTRRGADAVQRRQGALFALDDGEGVFECAFECAFEGAGDEAVLGLAGVELASGAVGVELRALNRQALPCQPRLVLVGELADRARGRRDGGRRDGFEERVGDGVV
jgi:hypothetical protein